MADPFDASPPRWSVLPPVDMEGMKYVGQNLGRYAAAGIKTIGGKKSFDEALGEVDDPFFQLKRARMGAELEEIQSKVALDKMGYLIKQKTIQQQTQSELDAARIFAETEGDPSKLLAYQYSGSNPYTIRTLAQMKLSASKDLTVQARQYQEIGWNRSLTQMTEHGDAQSAETAAQIFNSVRKNGWTDENIQAYTAAWGAHNVRNPKTESLDSFGKAIVGAGLTPDEIKAANRNRVNVLAPNPESAAVSGAAKQIVREKAELKSSFRKARKDLARVQASFDKAKKGEQESTWGPQLEGAKAAFNQAKADLDEVEGKTQPASTGGEMRPVMGDVRKAGDTVPVAEAAAPKTVPKVQNQADIDAAIDAANKAIADGKDPAAVRNRLKEMGIQLKE